MNIQMNFKVKLDFEFEEFWNLENESSWIKLWIWFQSQNLDFENEIELINWNRNWRRDIHNHLDFEKGILKIWCNSILNDEWI